MLFQKLATLFVVSATHRVNAALTNPGPILNVFSDDIDRDTVIEVVTNTYEDGRIVGEKRHYYGAAPIVAEIPAGSSVTKIVASELVDIYAAERAENERKAVLSRLTAEHNNAERALATCNAELSKLALAARKLTGADKSKADKRLDEIETQLATLEALETATATALDAFLTGKVAPPVAEVAAP
jgi:hypothetical protein